jgi:hypothetical protein
LQQIRKVNAFQLEERWALLGGEYFGLLRAPPAEIAMFTIKYFPGIASVRSFRYLANTIIITTNALHDFHFSFSMSFVPSREQRNYFFFRNSS